MQSGTGRYREHPKRHRFSIGQLKGHSSRKLSEHDSRGIKYVRDVEIQNQSDDGNIKPIINADTIIELIILYISDLYFKRVAFFTEYLSPDSNLKK